MFLGYASVVVRAAATSPGGGVMPRQVAHTPALRGSTAPRMIGCGGRPRGWPLVGNAALSLPRPGVCCAELADSGRVVELL